MLAEGFWAVCETIKDPKAPCNCMVNTWALKGLPYHYFEAYVYTIKLLGAFGGYCGGLYTPLTLRLRVYK